MRLKDRSAIITGASRGIGAAIARRFAQEGAQVLNFDIAAPAAGTDGPGPDVAWLQGDVAQSHDCAAAVRHALDRWQRLDVLVNNAAISCPGVIEETSNEDIARRVLDVNLIGVFLMLEHALEAMRAAGRGAIVNIASIGAFVVNPEVHPSYAASKGGLIALTRHLSASHAHLGIRCNVICPGAVRTALWDTLPAAVRATYEGLHPLGLGRPEDVASLALHLASEESAWMTGAVLTLDGGNLTSGGLAAHIKARA